MGKDRAWGLQKRNVVIIPCGLMHFNEKLRPDPDGYHPRRFLDRALSGESEGHAKATKPFGGGSTHCPGRVFAEKQMIGLVAGILRRYDVEITSPTYTIPWSPSLMISPIDRPSILGSPKERMLAPLLRRSCAGIWTRMLSALRT